MMEKILPSNSYIILTGLGAPAHLYKEFSQRLNHKFPAATIQTIAWWNESDSGQEDLQKILQHSPSTLIAHSAGGVLALEMYTRFPAHVNQVVLIDSHFLSATPPFPSVEEFLSRMLINSNDEIKNTVMTAYEPVLKNNDSFFKSLGFAVKWIDANFEEVCRGIPERTVFYIGFTDSKYKLLDSDQIRKVKEFWQGFNVESEFFPMNHFGLIEPIGASDVMSCFG